MADDASKDSLWGRFNKFLTTGPESLDSSHESSEGEKRISTVSLTSSRLPFSREGLAPVALTEQERSIAPHVEEGNPHSRYQFGREELGRGGMGLVLLAYDRLLMRNVALKLPLPEMAEESGINALLKDESRLTARLEHPNIVPIYDLVSSRDGQCGYVMRRVEGERLSEVLRSLKRGEPDRLEAWGRVRLLTIFLQVVNAVGYAHSHHIIHRDLKPNNIMIGTYGEVLLLDWGLALSLDSHGPALPISSSAGFVGAPSYISPEQLEGEIARLDERSDLYSLGAILYEILTWTPPFERTPGEADEHFYNRIRSGALEPPSLRAPERRIPPVLEEICLKCLAKEPDERYSSALALHSDITAFLEGTREQEWRRRAAEATLRDARNLSRQYKALHEEARRLQQLASDARRESHSWDSLERKRPVWALQNQADRMEEGAMREFNEAEKTFLQAIGHDANFLDAREELAELYLQRFLQAEARGNRSELSYFEARVQAFDVRGRYSAVLKGDGELRIESEPPGASIVLYTFREEDRALKPATPRRLGRGPVRVSLPVGSYLAVLSLEGYRDVRFPVYISRTEKIEARVQLYREDELGPDFIYIPRGLFRMGGDPEAFSLDLMTGMLDDFAIGRLPVTAGEYLAFLNDLQATQPEEAEKRAPRAPQNNKPVWPCTAEGRFCLPNAPDEEGDRWEPDFPMIYVRWEDAMAYAAWRSKRDGKPYRLPTTAEWEKAGRGTDGRLFPWGDAFEATYCKNRDSKPGRTTVEPVGRYPQDVSPYGVQDMAGCVSEWTADFYGTSRVLRNTKGGNWTVGERTCRLARNLGYPETSSNVSLGFRLCFSLGERGTPLPTPREERVREPLTPVTLEGNPPIPPTPGIPSAEGAGY